jgi:rhamnosyltransferase
MRASIIIRTLNEARHLDDLLRAIASQNTNGLSWEVLLVDSGSTDGTLAIAEQHRCRILHISREQFSFGRSLNLGCDAARGDILVFVSGHCVPTGDTWLEALCRPLMEGAAHYVYGRQLGGPSSHYSERRIFAKYFPEQSAIPQDGFYCNNANAAILRHVWADQRFDEELTGLEDMELARRLARNGGRIGYISDAAVYHHHDEPWRVIRRRFEREAIALQHIMPQVHIGALDLVRYIVSSIGLDLASAYRDGVLLRNVRRIVQYRFWQYLGSYVGNNDHRKLSRAQKDQYFYPSITNQSQRSHAAIKSRRPVANEGQQ